MDIIVNKNYFTPLTTGQGRNTVCLETTEFATTMNNRERHIVLAASQYERVSVIVGFISIKTLFAEIKKIFFDIETLV